MNRSIAMVIMLAGILFFPLSAQDPVKIRLIDAVSKAPVAGASCIVSGQPLHAISDTSGILVLPVVSYPCSVTISHISYDPLTHILPHYPGVVLTLAMFPRNISLAEIKVKPTNAGSHNELKEISWNTEKIQQLPVSFGEVDIIKSLQNMPGIAKSGEIQPTLNVRGGNHGQTQVLLNGSTIYNLNHLLGIAPMFDPMVIGNISFLKNGYNPKYGNSLSSYLVVENKRFDDEKPLLGGTVGILSSHIYYETPLKKNKSYLLASIRQSYFDLVTSSYRILYRHRDGYKPLPKYQFRDMNLCYQQSILPKLSLDINLFSTHDNFYYTVEPEYIHSDWTNRQGSAVARYRINEFSSLSFTSGITNYEFYANYNTQSDISRKNNITSLEEKLDYYAQIGNIFTIETGMFLNLSSIALHSLETTGDDLVLRDSSSSLNFYYMGSYVNGKIKFSHTLSSSVGMRYDFFRTNKNYTRVSPRLQVNLDLPSGSGINLSYDKTYQYNHLLNVLGFNLPADLWIPSTRLIPPEEADQLALNATKQISGVRVSSGVYVKWLKKQEELRDGADAFFINSNDQLVFGKGFAYGIETSVNVDIKWFSGYACYTYAETKRKFDAINNGEWFRPAYDLPHQFDWVSTFKIDKKTRVALTWFYASGQVTTMATGFTYFQNGGEDSPYPLYTKRFNMRMPPMHRMDVSMVRSWITRWGESQLTLGIYNLYNKSNPYFSYFSIKRNEDSDLYVKAKSQSVFPLTPFISYSFKIY